MKITIECNFWAIVFEKALPEKCPNLSQQLTIETVEQGVKYLVSLLLTLNIFHTLF